MPVTLSQYRRVVRAFNSRSIHIKQHNIFKNAFNQSKVKQTIVKEIFTLFTSFLIFLLISSSWYLINLLGIKARFISLSVFRISYICILSTFIHHICLYLIIFNRNGDIEKNPGLKPNSHRSFCICPRNINILSPHDFLKLSLLLAHITVHKLNVICLSETYLDSFILHDDNNLRISGDNLYREDHPLNVERGGVCIYYNISVPLKIINIHYFQECINFEIKLYNFISLFRSPNHCQDDFEIFIPRDNRFGNMSESEKMQLFTQTFQNIMSNYILHETITCDDRNLPRIDEKSFPV